VEQAAKAAIRINEILVSPSGEQGAPAEPWVEVINVGSAGVVLGGMTLEVDGVGFQVPERSLEAGETVTLSGLQSLDGRRDSFLLGDAREVVLLDASARRSESRSWLRPPSRIRRKFQSARLVPQRDVGTRWTTLDSRRVAACVG
jgi:hypothetical protein